MNKNKYQRGSSLIEVLTASAILGLVAIVACSYLFTNLFSFSSASNNISLEREGRATLNALTDTIKKGSSISNVYDSSGDDSLKNTGEQKVSSLKIVDTSQLEEQGVKYRIVEVVGSKLKLDGITLCYTLKTESNAGFIVQPLPDDASFDECTGLRINLTLKKDNKEYSIESEAYFRNSR